MMTTENVERFRRWFDYEMDAHQQTIDSLNGVADDLRKLPAFQEAVDLFAHLMCARKLWLYRFGVANEAVTELFPRGVALESLQSIADEVHQVWKNYLNQLDDEGLQRSFVYQAFDGGKFKNTIGDILTQLFGHSWYHRGQIAHLLRAIGAEPAATDFVYWCREAIPDAAASR
ncbi:MAG: DinB family protein [Acidobacteriota bacterium]